MPDGEIDQDEASEPQVSEAELVDRRAQDLLLAAYAGGAVALFPMRIRDFSTSTRKPPTGWCH